MKNILQVDIFYIYDGFYEKLNIDYCLMNIEVKSNQIKNDELTTNYFSTKQTKC